MRSRSHVLRGTVGQWPGPLLAVVAAAILATRCTATAPIQSPAPTSASSRGPFEPPDVTPRPDHAAAPAGDGTKAIIHTALGDITIELYNVTAPVAATNFAKLAGEHFYDGVVFHRLVPGFVIQGGDPTGTGRGGPGYTIRDEPVVGDYERAIVAMARTPAPNSQGSQFFICVADLRGRLPTSGGYAIFGRVVDGMSTVDQIAALPNSGAPDNQALEPVAMTSVEIVAP